MRIFGISGTVPTCGTAHRSSTRIHGYSSGMTQREMLGMSLSIICEWVGHEVCGVLVFVRFGKCVGITGEPSGDHQKALFAYV